MPESRTAKINLSKYTTPKRAQLRVAKSLPIKFHPDAIYKAVRREHIRSIKINGRILILKSSLSDWIELHRD